MSLADLFEADLAFDVLPEHTIFSALGCIAPVNVPAGGGPKLPRERTPAAG